MTRGENAIFPLPVFRAGGEVTRRSFGRGTEKGDRVRTTRLKNTPGADGPERSAIVVTRAGGGDGLVDVPWLEVGFALDASDWVVLPDKMWRAAAEGDPSVWEALERKLLVRFYVARPELVAVTGYPRDRDAPDGAGAGVAELRRPVLRVRSLLLPAAVHGFWMDADGWLRDFVGHDGTGDDDVARRSDFLERSESPGGRRSPARSASPAATTAGRASTPRPSAAPPRPPRKGGPRLSPGGGSPRPRRQRSRPGVARWTGDPSLRSSE